MVSKSSSRLFCILCSSPMSVDFCFPYTISQVINACTAALGVTRILASYFQDICVQLRANLKQLVWQTKPRSSEQSVDGGPTAAAAGPGLADEGPLPAAWLQLSEPR